MSRRAPQVQSGVVERMEAATAAVAEVQVLTAMLRREYEQPESEEQFMFVLAMALDRIDTLTDLLIAALEEAA